MAGWRYKGEIPNYPKMIIIVAPHTSNWDFYYGIATVLCLKTRIYWMGKHTLFRFPIKSLLRWLGGIPIDRQAAVGVVEHMVKLFRERPSFVLVLAPEGTRKRVTKWKSGFHYIATKANVPIVMAYIDYARKEVGIGPALKPTGDKVKDFQEIARFYADKTARKPEQFEVFKV